MAGVWQESGGNGTGINESTAEGIGGGGHIFVWKKTMIWQAVFMLRCVSPFQRSFQ